MHKNQFNTIYEQETESRNFEITPFTRGSNIKLFISWIIPTEVRDGYYYLYFCTYLKFLILTFFKKYQIWGTYLTKDWQITEKFIFFSFILNKWRDKLCSSTGRLNIIKITILSKLIYKFNTIQIKIPALCVCVRTCAHMKHDKLILKFK